MFLTAWTSGMLTTLQLVKIAEMDDFTALDHSVSRTLPCQTCC